MFGVGSVLFERKRERREEKRREKREREREKTCQSKEQHEMVYKWEKEHIN